MNSIILGTILLFSFNCIAQIETYTSTDNTGINKLERIGVIESYLQKLSGTLKSMEAKLEAQDIKLKSLEANVSAIKEQDIKRLETQIAEKKAVKSEDKIAMEELEKLKADMVALKNDDIEGIAEQIRILKAAIDEIKYKKK